MGKMMINSGYQQYPTINMAPGSALIKIDSHWFTIKFDKMFLVNKYAKSRHLLGEKIWNFHLGMKGTITLGWPKKKVQNL